MEAAQPSLDCCGSELHLAELGPHVAAWEGFPAHCSLSPGFSLWNTPFSLSSSLVLSEMGIAGDMFLGD